MKRPRSGPPTNGLKYESSCGWMRRSSPAARKCSAQRARRAGRASEPEARAFFESLATFYRNGYVRWIEGAKRPETRSARIAEMLGLLRGGQKQR